MTDQPSHEKAPLSQGEKEIFAAYEQELSKIQEDGRPSYALVSFHHRPKRLDDILTAISLDVDKLIEAGDWDDAYELTCRHMDAETDLQFSKFAFFFPDDPEQPDGPGVIRLDLGVEPEAEER